MEKWDDRERRDHYQRVFLRDAESLGVLDDLLAMLYYWDEVFQDEMILHNTAIGIMEIMGLHRPETRLDILRVMKAKALEIQAMETPEDN